MIKSMLAAGLVDDLRMAIVPVLLGGGLRLLPDGVPASRDLVSSATLSNVSLAVHYQRR